MRVRVDASGTAGAAGSRDGVTRGAVVARSARRGWSWVQCRVGRHTWVRRSNPDLGGAQAVYHLCRRCGRERPVWEYRSYDIRGTFSR